MVLGLLVAAAALAAGGWFANRGAAAAELDKLDTALKLIPDDAAIYWSLLHGRELVEAVGKSNAWQKLTQLQFVQMGLVQYQFMAAMADSPPAKIEAFRNSPDGRKLLRLLGEMASEEMFVYGDPTQIRFVELLQDVIGAVNSPVVAIEEALQRGIMPGRHDARAKAVLQALAHDLDLIGVPERCLGASRSRTRGRPRSTSASWNRP